MSFSQDFLRAVLQNAPLEDFIPLLDGCNQCNFVLQKDVPDSPIHLAVVNDRLDIVKLLVQHGAFLEPIEIYPESEAQYPGSQDFDIDIDDDDRFTGDPLVTAAGSGKQEIFNFLAPIASVKHRRHATLYLAEGLKRVSTYFSEDDMKLQEVWEARPHKADRDAIGQWMSDLAKSMITELSMLAAMKSASSRFIEMYRSKISQGVVLDTVVENSCTFLWTAAHNGYVEAVDDLIKLGASVDIANQKDGWTPLMIAVDSHIPWAFGTKYVWGEAGSRQIEIVDLLLQAGANVNHQGHNGENALILASQYKPGEGFEGDTLDIAIREMEHILRSATID